MTKRRYDLEKKLLEFSARIIKIVRQLTYNSAGNQLKGLSKLDIHLFDSMLNVGCWMLDVHLFQKLAFMPYSTWTLNPKLEVMH